MGKWVLRNLGLYLGRLRLASAVNSLDLGLKSAVDETPNFEGDGWAEILSGTRDASWKFRGYWMPDTVALPLDSGIWGGFEDGERQVALAVKPAEGSPLPAIGDVAWMAEAVQIDATPGFMVGKAAKLDFSLRGTGPTIRGKVAGYANGATGPSSGALAPVTIAGGVPDGKSLYFAVSCFYVAGTTPALTISVESDNADGFASPVVRATSPEFQDGGAYFGTVAGPITDDRFRLVLTVSGTAPVFGYIAALGVR
ncbi:MAG: hypothetical protein IPQ07_39970 [Myxococcales bacterium]|nr:hypothetical protein [Myxococcales bacterium]